MKLRTTLITAVALLTALVLAACGGGPPAALTDIPAYPKSAQLAPGESTIGDTLANNNQVDAAMRSQLGVGGKTEQQGFRLPTGAEWDQVKGYYEEKLKAAGWSSSSMVSGMLEQVNQGNDLFRTANWQKGKQNVTIVMLTSPIDAAQKELIVSLSTN